jgi:hypothetical protein
MIQGVDSLTRSHNLIAQAELANRTRCLYGVSSKSFQTQGLSHGYPFVHEELIVETAPHR